MSSIGITGAASPAVLRAQLNRYEIQLADWTHCGSAKTPAGKAKIQEITDQADTVKAQIKKVEAAQPSPLASAAPGGRVDVYA